MLVIFLIECLHVWFIFYFSTQNLTKRYKSLPIAYSSNIFGSGSYYTGTKSRNARNHRPLPKSESKYSLHKKVAGWLKRYAVFMIRYDLQSRPNRYVYTQCYNYLLDYLFKAHVQRLQYSTSYIGLSA